MTKFLPKKVATTAAVWRAVVYAVLAANRVLMGATSCYIANLFSNSSENLIPDEILYSWGKFRWFQSSGTNGKLDGRSIERDGTPA